MKRVDSASKVIAAPASTIYRAFVDASALVSWLPPKGMRARFDVFEPRVGGRYRMVLTYEAAEHSSPGKASAHEDVVDGEFVELVPDQRVVQRVQFVSDDPALAGAMKMTWSLKPVSEGTEVSIRCEDVPDGIRKEDHDVGLRSSLENLAAFVKT